MPISRSLEPMTWIPSSFLQMRNWGKQVMKCHVQIAERCCSRVRKWGVLSSCQTAAFLPWPYCHGNLAWGEQPLKGGMPDWISFVCATGSSPAIEKYCFSKILIRWQCSVSAWARQCWAEYERRLLPFTEPLQIHPEHQPKLTCLPSPVMLMPVWSHAGTAGKQVVTVLLELSTRNDVSE